MSYNTTQKRVKEKDPLTPKRKNRLRTGSFKEQVGNR
jgi:hypothetical protein